VNCELSWLQQCISTWQTRTNVCKLQIKHTVQYTTFTNVFPFWLTLARVESRRLHYFWDELYTNRIPAVGIGGSGVAWGDVVGFASCNPADALVLFLSPSDAFLTLLKLLLERFYIYDKNRRHFDMDESWKVESENNTVIQWSLKAIVLDDASCPSHCWDDQFEMLLRILQLMRMTGWRHGC